MHTNEPITLACPDCGSTQFRLEEEVLRTSTITVSLEDDGWFALDPIEEPDTNCFDSTIRCDVCERYVSDVSTDLTIAESELV